MRIRSLTNSAKRLASKRGGTDALKEDAAELKEIAKGSGSITDKAKAAGAAARRTVDTIKENRKEVENAGLGLAAGWVGAKYYGKMVATRAAKGQSITIPKTGVTYGKAIGGLAAGLGALGVLGDDRTNTIALVSGAMVLGADIGVESYLDEAAKLAAAA